MAERLRFTISNVLTGTRMERKMKTSNETDAAIFAHCDKEGIPYPRVTKKTSKAVPQVDPPVFTPLDINGQRLSFNLSQVEFMPGYFAGRGKRGLKGQVKIDGVLFNVTARSCGLDCYCDAIITPVETKAVPQTVHTPGPWTFDESFDGDYAAILGGDKDATVIMCIESEEGAPTDADRNLMLAAPELLAALEAIAGMVCNHGAQEFCPRDVARAAILKAKGGAK